MSDRNYDDEHEPGLEYGILPDWSLVGQDCTMCEDAPATTRWGFPVCQDCYDGLISTQAILDEMEADDPVLAEQGRKVEAAMERFLAVGQEDESGSNERPQ